MSLDLEAIEARAAVATPGPWADVIEWRRYRSQFLVRAPGGVVVNHIVGGGTNDDGAANAAFIAAARTDVSALVAEVRRLREALEGLLHWTWDPDANVLQQFEEVADAYYRDTGFLRPGKSEPLECGRDPNSAENRARFDKWRADYQRNVRGIARAALTPAAKKERGGAA